MIPKLIPNEEFYNTISTGNRQYFRNMEEPYEEYANLDVAVYPVNDEMFIGKDNLFNNFKCCMLEDWGYCPSEFALVDYLKPYIKADTNYFVTVHFVSIETAKEDESYATFINAYGEDTDMDVYDYIDEYGCPPTQYEGKLIKFCIYVLE